MTTTALAPACPKCGGALWDNRGKKTNPKAPDFKCKTATCDGVIWPPRATKAPPAQAPVSTSVYRASVAESALPPFLRNAEAEDKAELAAKIGEVPSGLDKKASVAWAQRQSLAVVLDVYEPMFRAKEIGMTDDTVHKLSFELFKTWADKGLVG